MLVSIAWIGPAVLAAIDAVAQHHIWRQPGAVDARRVLFVSLDWLLYALLTPGVFVLARRWPLVRGSLVPHGALHVGASLLFCVAWAGLGTVLRSIVDPRAIAGEPLRHFTAWLFTTLPFGVAVYLAVVGVEHALRYHDGLRERETQMARLAEQLTTARLSALQAQLNPHFLFNSLNTVAVLVRAGDGAAAARVIEQLSEVLRATLGSSTAAEHTLGEELTLVRQYLDVEQARFSDRLQPLIHGGPTLLSAAVPRFAVQHLVENAVRHGIARRSDAERVEVHALRRGDRLEISVIDDGAGLHGDIEPPGHGIANTRERLRTLYGNRASLTVARRPEGGAIAVLTLPYREMTFEEREHDAEG
jgi:two-component system LytT family sensor kinase